MFSPSAVGDACSTKDPTRLRDSPVGQDQEPLLLALGDGAEERAEPAAGEAVRLAARVGPLVPLAPGLMCPLQTLEKLIDKCRLFPQTVLFSGFNDGASLDSLHGFSVPLE